MTATTPASLGVPTPVTGASQGAVNHVEHAVIDYLTGQLVDMLTDRTGAMHEFPWTPSDRVRIGVLGPTVLPAQPPAVGGTNAHQAAAPAVPAPGPAMPDNSGTIGVDFVVSNPGNEIQLEVDVRYVLYHPLWAPFASVQQAAQEALRSAGATTRRARPSVRLRPSWVRDERHVVVPVEIAVNPNDEVTVKTGGPGDLLATDAHGAVVTHFARGDALFLLSNNQTMAAQNVVSTEADYIQERNSRRDPSWTSTIPIPTITASTFPTEDGGVAVSVSLTNDLVLAQRDRVQDLALYDTRMSVRVTGQGSVDLQRLGFASEDCRYNEYATVVGRGRSCVAVGGTDPNVIVAETLPIYTQSVALTAEPFGVDIGFDGLATNATPTLEMIASGMRRFLRDWPDTSSRPPVEHAQLERMRGAFAAEVERFELGYDLLQRDPRLGRAFRLANESFEGARPGQRWRLFQLVFIVSELGALAAREDPGDLRLAAELDAVDVLWFPTGGGKTEAYLGLIVVALFYDRLRGKERGTSAWLLFPLRMLSVQQLARLTHVIHHAEQVRAGESLPGDALSLGYFVGSGNTPNRLAPNDRNSWWPGLVAFAGWDEQERDHKRLVGACPSCGAGDSVGLDADVINERLVHICRSCNYLLPIYSSDDEVARYLPAVIVSTVDKITAFARQGQLTSLNRGPSQRCPQHGYHSHARCVVEGCIAPVPHVAVSGFKDPTPALWIQDELHLVREDLGVFAAHYHTLMAELARGAGNRASKVIAATATIEQFEDQLSQVYGRNPRMFPTGGPTLQRSFYTHVVDDVRRVYLGVLPAGGGTVKVDLAGAIVTHLIEAVHELEDTPAKLVAHLVASGINHTDDEVRALLFDYELALAYVNSKAHGVQILDDVHRLSERLINNGSDRIRAEYVTGETTLGDLASVVAAVQNVPPGTPRSERIRALVGTSVVSHGVDLDRLNFAVMAGMPPAYAHYIQATARAGRSHVGLVVSVFDRFNRRETSMFQSFMTTHAALERMVEPVPVNRFATRAVQRTLPGIVCSLLWDETRNLSHGTTESIQTTRRFRDWWNTNGAVLIPLLRDRIARAYRCPVPQPGFVDEEQRLVGRAEHRWEQIEKPRMEQWAADFLTDLFTSGAMTSLRDVNEPVEFAPLPQSAQVVERML